MSRREFHLLQSSVDPADCLWQGKPLLIPYLLVNRHVAAGLAAAVVLLLWQGTQAPITWIVAALAMIASVTGVLHWTRQAYYVTQYGLVVESGENRYCLYWQEIRTEEVTVMPNLIERLFGCGTVRYAFRPRGSRKADPWRHKARFWCIRDFEKVHWLICSTISGNVPRL